MSATAPISINPSILAHLLEPSFVSKPSRYGGMSASRLSPDDPQEAALFETRIPRRTRSKDTDVDRSGSGDLGFQAGLKLV